ncbi:MAG TPA: TMEM175 family protein [Ktedonobacteraceae bacterium]|nr:TMEM175 family protein [Ktedonobacteraceae bacterium]
MDEKETGRVEAFSDGVFAVAITLLILNIQPPPLSDHGQFADQALLDYLINQWPMLLAFVTSFASIGVMWMNHHKVFSLIRYTDTPLLTLNLLLLLVIVFIPYPTALLAQQYATYPQGHVAALLYTGTDVLLATCFNLLWRYASHHNRLLNKQADSQEVTAIKRQYLLGPVVQLITFGLAWINVPASILLCLLLTLFFALPGRLPHLHRP